MNRVTGIVTKDENGNTLPEYIKYTYAMTGAKLTVENENLKTSYTYDSFGQMVKETESNGIIKEYAYDIAGNRTTFKLIKNGATKMNMEYTYDRLERMESVKSNSITEAIYHYDANGNQSVMEYANGISTVYEYNKANMVTKLTNHKSGQVLSGFEYAYYLDKNQSMKREADGRITEYRYDGCRQLIEESENDNRNVMTKQYTYDMAGNRSGLKVSGDEAYEITYLYDGNNRLVRETKNDGGKLETGVYFYDGNGNQISKFTERTESSPYAGALDIFELGKEADVTYEINRYDSFNRLAETEQNGLKAEYQYKANGMRQGKRVNGEETIHIWDGVNIVGAMSQAGAVIELYYRGIGLIKGENTGYYLYNAHGDVVQLSGEGGSITRKYRYDAFGVEQIKDESDRNPWRYCGEYFDSSSGTYYLRNRYYNPQNGRFTSEDPIRDGLNWYTYCAGNPVTFIDPSGLWKQGDQKLSSQAQAYTTYYGNLWADANNKLQSATTATDKAKYQAEMTRVNGLANDIRALDAKGKVTGSVYDVPIFNQGNLNLCWAYSQTMVEAFYSGTSMTQQQADTRARSIAESVYGPVNWNQGGWPTNSPDVTSISRLIIGSNLPSFNIQVQTPSIQSVNNFKTLKKFVANSPVYGYFSSNNGAHLIVVTGTASAKGHVDIVTSNNPWGVQNIQSYNNFTNLSNMTFSGILRATP